MNIAIVIHTQTGTTRTFAELIAKNLRDRQHTVDIIELQVEGSPKLRTEDAKISNVPDCSKYDAVLMGGPVWGFRATPVIITCLKKISGISGKKFLPFITMGFPFAFMGGKQTIAFMSKMAADSRAEVLSGVIITKMFHNYHALMQKESARIAEMF